MNKGTSGISSRLLRRLLVFVWTALILGGTAAKADPAKTLVQDTLYRADGSVAQGSVTIRWSGFSTSAGEAVAAGEMTVATDGNGKISIPLIPNTGSNPSGGYYRVVIKLNDGTTSEELWVVPSAATTTVSAIRAKMVPQAVAAQFVGRDYVDTAMSELSTTTLVHLTGAETIQGVKTFVSSPEVPAPGDAGAATNKQYVDQQVSALAAEIPSQGTPGSPAAVNGTNGNFSGSVVVGTSCPATSGAGTLEAQTVNGVLNAACFAGSDAAAKINAALASCASGGNCTVDATALGGAQNWGSTVALTQPGTHLILGCATYSGAANPMLSLASSTSVEGCAGGTSTGGGTTFNLTGGNGGVMVGGTSGFTTSPLLRNLSITTSSTTPVPYGLQLNNATAFQVDNVSVDGNNGTIQAGYLMHGAEQGEVHGGALLINSLVNVDWQSSTAGGARFASGNGVDFHSLTLQNSVTNGTNVLYEANCCDDFNFHSNHLVISKGALINIEVDASPSYGGALLIADNHIENYSGTPYQLTSPASAWVVKLNGSMGAILRGNNLNNGPSPYNLVLVTGNAQRTVIDGNSIGGLIQIDAGASQTTIANNACTGGEVIDNGYETNITNNRGNCTYQDKVSASGFLASDILQFYPKLNAGAVAGTNWGLHVMGKATSGFEIYHRLSAVDGTSSVTLSSVAGGTPYFYIHGAPGDGQNWLGLTQMGASFNGTINANSYIISKSTMEAQGINLYSVGGIQGGADYTNYQRLAITPQGPTNFQIMTQNGGTGQPMALTLGSGIGQPIQLAPGGSTTWYLDGSGNVLCRTDGGCAIGAGAGNRPANLFLQNYLNVNNNFMVGQNGAVTAASFATGDWTMDNAGNLSCSTDGGCNIGPGGNNRPANLFLQNYLNVAGNYTVGASGNWVAKGNGQMQGGTTLTGYSDGGTTMTYWLNGANGAAEFNGGVRVSSSSSNLAYFGSGTTGNIGGSALAAGQCASGTVTVANATSGMVVMATPVTYPGDAIDWKAYVSAAGTVTVKVCAMVAATPTASAYNVRVIQ